MRQTNFLIGRGELLTHDIKGPKRPPGKAAAYTFDEAVMRLIPQFNKVAKEIESIPKTASPGDFVVGQLIMNPSYIARSYFPTALLNDTGLVSIGSKNISIKPEKWTKKSTPCECSTTGIFVAGKRKAFRHLQDWATEIEKDSDEALDLTHIENFRIYPAEDRVLNLGKKNNRFFEVCLHLIPNINPDFIFDSFEQYAEKLGFEVHSNLSFYAGSLWFVPIEGPRNKITPLSQFVFTRVIRPTPKLRGLRPLQRSASVALNCSLTNEQPLSSEPKVAILDGGLPQTHTLIPWVKNYKRLDEDALDDPDGPNHGLATTSAFLFGPITPGEKAQRPPAFVDHLRVLDQKSTHEDPLELYRTLELIEEVLLSRQYEFINLSLGPDLEINDNEVHSWTSVIDDHLSDGETFMTVAAGNNGERDHDLGYNRIQIPADCVNAISVGACDDTNKPWSRAPYSAIGPGRSPGAIKPDLMAFGGSPTKYFHVIAPGQKATLSPELGTSFAAPNLLRSAVSIRAILGADLTPLAIKALLIHSAQNAGHDIQEVGWGKVPEDAMEIITCPEGVARIVYQGELKPGKYLRAQLPLPKGGVTGRIRLKATFCYASHTDPQDSCAYTRAGLEVTFRPNITKTNPDTGGVKTKSFFTKKKYATELELRSDQGKWETVLHDELGILGSSLNKPIFDIHYNARESGGTTRNAEKIRYALIITIEAPKCPEIHNDILGTYASILTPIQPKVSLPIRI